MVALACSSALAWTVIDTCSDAASSGYKDSLWHLALNFDAQSAEPSCGTYAGYSNAVQPLHTPLDLDWVLFYLERAFSASEITWVESETDPNAWRVEMTLEGLGRSVMIQNVSRGTRFERFDMPAHTTYAIIFGTAP